jgi:predicted metal-dependent hydrolase
VSVLVQDDLEFTLRTSPRRRTIQITVERDGELVLTAPPEASSAQLHSFVLEKRFWIYTRLAEKERLRRSVPAKEFVDGEGFLYLGRSYPLKLVDEQVRCLTLNGGRFHLRRDAVTSARRHFVRWYSGRARAWLKGKVSQYRSRMEADVAEVKVQDLGYRWGSCGKGNRIYFHWKTILLPPHIAEYIVVHEIAHLHESLHTPGFWLRVERVMPDFARRKTWLAENGMSVEGLR